MEIAHGNKSVKKVMLNQISVGVRVKHLLIFSKCSYHAAGLCVRQILRLCFIILIPVQLELFLGSFLFCAVVLSFQVALTLTCQVALALTC